MNSVVTRALFACAIFILIPVTFLLINWHWTPDSLNQSSLYLLWITDSAGLPFAIITSVIFFFILFFCQKKRILKFAVILCLFLVGMLSLGQVVKSIIKTAYQDPRPYVNWIDATKNIEPQYFYSLERKERALLIENTLSGNKQIPSWLKNHWKNETGYTFPSGHTMFATMWAFLFILLLPAQRYLGLIIIVTGWSIFVEISRIALGMHNPIDIIIGAIISCILSILGYFCAKKWHIVE